MPSKLTIDILTYHLRRHIRDRTGVPGTRLTEASLSRKLKVSHAPIREALRRLEGGGLLPSKCYKGFAIQPITIEDIVQLYTSQISLEGLAGKLSTPFFHEDERNSGRPKDSVKQ